MSRFKEFFHYYYYAVLPIDRQLTISRQYRNFLICVDQYGNTYRCQLVETKMKKMNATPKLKQARRTTVKSRATRSAALQTNRTAEAMATLIPCSVNIEKLSVGDIAIKKAKIARDGRIRDIKQRLAMLKREL